MLVHVITMAILTSILLISITLFFLFFQYIAKKRHRRHFGFLPSLFLNFDNINGNIAEILVKNNGTIIVKPWLANFNMLFTSDPANVQYIMSKNFSKYPKGTPWRKRFDIFGDALFNSDFDEWAYHRKNVRSFLSHQQFHQFVQKILRECIEMELVPILEHVSNQQIVVDLQALLRRQLSYFSCSISAGCKPEPFNLSLPQDPFTKAMDDACEAILARHLMPESIWKLQRLLGLGKEKKLSNAHKMLDHIFEQYMVTKQEKLTKGTTQNEEEEFSALKCYMTRHEVAGPRPATYKVMRDNVLGLIFAAQDTTNIALSWFFWLLSNNPRVEAKIRDELGKILPMKEGKKIPTICTEEINKMVYLHAALCESLRLFPPVPFETRSPMEQDILPSGHHINPKTEIIISSYAMGRMTSVWGQDCNEYKPERWIREDGSIKHEPPHKFFAFNAGPRVCPGKEVAFILLKTFASTIIQNYHVEVVDGHLVVPKPSIVLQLKHGLMVRFKKVYC